MPDSSLPRAGSAQVHVVHEGYVRETDGQQHVGGTVTLIIDGDAVIVVDPGMVASRDELLAAIAQHGVQPGVVTDVVFSHHHPDHTVNAALFPAARIHDHWAIYDGDLWISREADGAQLSPSVTLIASHGHTREDITTLAAAPNGVHACTHAWWAGGAGPAGAAGLGARAPATSWDDGRWRQDGIPLGLGLEVVFAVLLIVV